VRRFTDVRRLGLVSSTNDEALRLVAAGSGPGLVVIAEGQTAGRGRPGSTWISSPGSGLFLSAVIQKPDAATAPLVAGAAGVAAADAVRTVTGAAARLKWPNDVWVDGKKVGGVLIELPGGDSTVAVVGIGITLRDPGAAAPPGAAPLAGLADLLGKPVSRQELAVAVLATLDAALDLAERDPAALCRRYRELDALAGREITVETTGGRISGRVTEVDLLRGIELEAPDGSRRRLKPEHTHVVAIGPPLRRILLGSANAKKLAELRRCLEGLPVEVASPADLPEPIPSPEEPHRTFLANATEKALAYARASGLLTLADDSGLEVDALGGLPGVDSAYFAGRPSDDEANNRKLLADLRGVPAARRTARYRCTLVLALPDRVLFSTSATCEGRIAESPAGTEGFGYDPLFLVGSSGTTSFGQLDPRAKDEISHRGKALAELRAALPGILAAMEPR
jgi:XTP/dITP diphosphohydrolase